MALSCISRPTLKLASRVPARPLRLPSVRTYAAKGDGAAKEFVEKAIAENKAVMFSKSWCPFCGKARAALDMFTQNYTAIELDNRPDADDIQDALGEITGGRSVPRVFIGGKFIGGGDDTAMKASSGELKQLLSAQGLC